MFQEIYIIDNQEDFTESLKELFKKDTNFKLINVKETQIDNIFQNIPEIIVINEDNISTPTLELCKTQEK